MTAVPVSVTVKDDADEATVVAYQAPGLPTLTPVAALVVATTTAAALAGRLSATGTNLLGLVKHLGGISRHAGPADIVRELIDGTAGLQVRPDPAEPVR